MLTARENWRTEQERKASEQVKMFLVGCVLTICILIGSPVYKLVAESKFHKPLSSGSHCSNCDSEPLDSAP